MERQARLGLATTRDAPMLTTKAIEGLQATGNQFELTDGRVPGLRMRVSQDGTKTFVLLYRHRGTRRRQRLGRFPEMGLAEAREAAMAVLSEVRSGSDPVAKKPEPATTLTTVADLVEDFIFRHVERHNKPSTVRGTSRILRKDIVGAWGQRDARDIARADVAELIEGIAEARSPFGASNVFRAGRTFFNWLVSREVIATSPFLGAIDPAGIKKRDRVLTADEIRAIWLATGEIGVPWGSIIRLLFTTGRRRGEVVEAEWGEFDFERGVWEIPARRTKASRMSIKPITVWVRRELDGLGGERQGLLFPSFGEGSPSAVSGFSKMKARLDRLSGVTDWRLHDIRRTVATNLGVLGIADTTIARILDHHLIGVPEVTGIYNRYHYVAEMREALERWEGRLGEVVRTAPGGGARFGVNT